MKSHLLSKTVCLYLSFFFILSSCSDAPNDNPEQIIETQEQEAAASVITQYSIDDFMANTSYGGASFSPDNSKILVSNNRSGIFNIYALPVDGSEEVQLTNSTTDANFAVGYFNADERFIYRADQGGNELAHLYVRELDGSVTDLTPGENLVASFNDWTDDYQAFFVQTNERDQRYFDVYKYKVADGYPRELVYENNESLFPGGLSNSGRYLTLIEIITTSNTNIYIQDLETGERTLVTPHEGNVASSSNTFSQDDQYLYYTTDEGSEFQQLMRYELATGEKEKVINSDWDVMFAYFSREYNYLVVGINAEASTELRMYDASTMDPVTLPDMNGVSVTSVYFSHGDTSMAMYANSSRSPGDLFVQSLEDAGEPQQLTHSLNNNITPDDLVDAEVVYFASYDGLQIPGLLYKPHQTSADHKAPALVLVHGGPGGQTRVGFSDMVQYLVNHGYVVYGINNRGSSGYGKTFNMLDDRQHGEADLGDVVASKQMLIETAYVDPERVGIIGGSYGGYMTVAAMAFEPDVFKVGVDIFGVTNWVRTLESIPPWWEAQREALYTEMGDPATDLERLERISPLFHAENIVNPMIVLQGANDPRVLQVESDELVQAIRDNDVIVEYIVFPDEGHGFRNRSNQAVGYKAILDFLDTYL